MRIIIEITNKNNNHFIKILKNYCKNHKGNQHKDHRESNLRNHLEITMEKIQIYT